MYFGVNSSGTGTIVPDDAWRDYYKSKAQEVGLNSCVGYVYYGFIFFYFSGNPYGYGGDYKEDWVKERKYGKWGSSRICQIKNTIVVNELYGDDSVHVVKIGSVSFSYRQMYPGNDMAQILDSVDGKKIVYSDNGWISKIGYTSFYFTR